MIPMNGSEKYYLAFELLQDLVKIEILGLIQTIWVWNSMEDAKLLAINNK